MKNIKFLAFILALTVLAACGKSPANEADTEEVSTSESVVVEETVLPETGDSNSFKEEDMDKEAAQSDNMGDIQELFSGCQTDADCAVVFPSCCKEAYAPYFVNNEYKDELIKEYKRITGEPEQCPEVSKCPRSSFAGAKAACVGGRCLESIFDKPAFQ